MEKSAGRSAAPQGRIVVALTVLALARLYIADPPAFRPSSARARGRGTACRNCALAEPDQRGQAGDDLRVGAVAGLAGEAGPDRNELLLLPVHALLSGSFAASREGAWSVPTGRNREAEDWSVSVVEIAGFGPRRRGILQGSQVLLCVPC